MGTASPLTLRPEIAGSLATGVVIPAHPLALTAERTLDVAHQAALTRYYLAAGAGGVAVGVHSTQFAIREHGIYRQVLGIAADVVNVHRGPRPVITIAGVIGPTAQAVAEARVAAELGYDIALVSLGGLKGWSEDELVEHVAQVAAVLPVMGFYLQPSVGGQLLSHTFWRRVAELPGVVGIKMAPFNRYQTIDVVRGVAESSRRDEIALYTGNDDNILPDLLTTYRFTVQGQPVEKRIVGGLLGHWAVWTQRAVEQLAACHAAVASGTAEDLRELLSLGIEVTDSNSALFDVAHNFAGCIPGIHEILRRQGLLAGRWCLDPHEDLSPGQLGEIDRVCAAYPHLTDDAFVTAHRDDWLAVGTGAEST